MPIIRCVFGCKQFEYLHHFPVPKDPHLEKFNAWKNVVGDPLIGIDDFDIYKRFRICNRHFHRRFLYPNSRKLSRTAVPTKEHCSDVSTCQTFMEIPFVDTEVEVVESDADQNQFEQLVTKVCEALPSTTNAEAIVKEKNKDTVNEVEQLVKKVCETLPPSTSGEAILKGKNRDTVNDKSLHDNPSEKVVITPTSENGKWDGTSGMNLKSNEHPVLIDQCLHDNPSEKVVIAPTSANEKLDGTSRMNLKSKEHPALIVNVQKRTLFDKLTQAKLELVQLQKLFLEEEICEKIKVWEYEKKERKKESEFKERKRKWQEEEYKLKLAKLRKESNE